MPSVRYVIKDEYALGKPKLDGVAANRDPDELLKSVAVAGLVGILRQLGNLAQFASEVFQHLNEEVVATASRGHQMMLRVQHVETELPQVTQNFLSQTSYTLLKCNAGIEWHPDLPIRQRLMSKIDMPGFISHSLVACRGPPCLSNLDKFDIAGDGACLKRYTDPSIFRTELNSTIIVESLHPNERKTCKTKIQVVNGKEDDINGYFSKSSMNSRAIDVSSGKAVGLVSKNHIKLKRNPLNYFNTSIKSYIEYVRARKSGHNSEESTPMVDSVSLCGTDDEFSHTDTDNESNQNSYINPQESADGLTTNLVKQVVVNTLSGNFLQSSSTEDLVDDSVNYVENEFTESYYGDSATESEVLLTELESNDDRDDEVTEDISNDLDPHTDGITKMEPENEIDTETLVSVDFPDTESQPGVSDKDDWQHDLHFQYPDSDYDTANIKKLRTSNLSEKEQTDISGDSLDNIYDLQPSDRCELLCRDLKINGSTYLSENIKTHSGENEEYVTSKVVHETSQVKQSESKDNVIQNEVCKDESAVISGRSTFRQPLNGSSNRRPTSFDSANLQAKNEVRSANKNLKSVSADLSEVTYENLRTNEACNKFSDQQHAPKISSKLVEDRHFGTAGNSNGYSHHADVNALPTEPYKLCSGLEFEKNNLKDDIARHDSSLKPSNKASDREINLHTLHDNVVPDQHAQICEASTSGICQLHSSSINGTKKLNMLELNGGRVSDIKSPPEGHEICVTSWEKVYSVPSRNLDVTEPPVLEGHEVLAECQKPKTCDHRRESKEASQKHVLFNHVASKSLVDLPSQYTATKLDPIHQHGHSHSESNITHLVGQSATVKNSSRHENVNSGQHPGVGFNVTLSSQVKEVSVEISNRPVVQPCLPSQSGSKHSVRFSEKQDEILPHEGESTVDGPLPSDNGLQDRLFGLPKPMTIPEHEGSQCNDPNLPARSLLPPSTESIEERRKVPRVKFMPMHGTSDAGLQEMDEHGHMTSGKPSSVVGRPRDPLIESVAAHDRSTMKKVSEMFQTRTTPKIDGMSKLLEQIRNKNFNLKPATVARPNIVSRPVTNLKLAAMLEKANTIRVALAGSDEDDDDDDDNWD